MDQFEQYFKKKHTITVLCLASRTYIYFKQYFLDIFSHHRKVNMTALSCTNVPVYIRIRIRLILKEICYVTTTHTQTEQQYRA